MTAPGGPAQVSAGDAAPPGGRLVTFIQYDEPALKDGEYTITVRQDTNQPAPNNSFQASRQFAVAGERFSFDPSDLAAVFPPDLAAGELSGVLPHVLFNRATLPWERSATGDAGAPWLALLLFDDGQAPAPMPRTVKDLIPAGTPITAAGSAVTGTGILPAGFASYPGINPLGYGETPDDACTTIDVDAKVFSAIAPAAADLPFLAHIRETDTAGAQDATQATSSLAVVLGNRVPQDGVTAHAYLVSVENMGPLLPTPDGRPAPGLPPGVTTVRLLTYRWWSFLATGGRSATFQALLEGVNTAGTADITVTTPAGTSATSSADQFTYIPSTPPAPTPAPLAVTGVSPASGPAAGGTSVTITGTGLTGATDVRFGGAAAQPFTVDSSGTQITATSPPSTGTVDITVTTPAGTSATSSAGQFTYIELPPAGGLGSNRRRAGLPRATARRLLQALRRRRSPGG